MVLQDDAGPGLEEPASSLQLAQLLLQEQLDARACARLCWLQMEGPYLSAMPLGTLQVALPPLLGLRLL